MSVQVSYSKDQRHLPELRAVCSGCGCKGAPVEGRPTKRGRPDLEDPAFRLAEQVSGFHPTTVRLPGRRMKFEVRLYCAACWCSKCKRGPATACRYCKVMLCETCGAEHDPPDCPPQWDEYLRALADHCEMPEETGGIRVQEDR